MILGFEDFGVIFALLTPVYYLAWSNHERINALELRLSKILKLGD